MSVDKASIKENGGIATGKLTLLTPSSKDVEVSLNFSGLATNGIDYITSNTSAITIPAGLLFSTFTITSQKDRLEEGDESINIDIVGVVNGVEKDNQTASVLIVDNKLPIVSNSIKVGSEDTEVRFSDADFTSNFTDADGDLLDKIRITSLPYNGLLRVNGIAVATNSEISLLDVSNLVFIPNPNWNGSTSFQWSASDYAGFSHQPATLKLDIAPVADPVVACDDNATINEDEILNGSTVLGNDKNPDGGTFKSTLKSGPAHGKLLLKENGEYTYTPDANYNGPDSFIYTASNEASPVSSMDASVFIDVKPVDDPVVANDDDGIVDEDNTLNGQSVLSNDTNIDGGSFVAAIKIHPSHGVLTLNPDGTYVYMPHSNYNGSDSFSYTACNNVSSNGCAVATVNITVNPLDDKVEANPDFAEVDEDSQVNAPSVLDNDNNFAGGFLTPTVKTLPLHGTLTFDATGKFTYTPNANFNGTDSFTYEVCNSMAPQNCGEALVSIKVKPVVDPVVAKDDAYSVDEDVTLSGTSVLLNDVDVDGGPFIAQLASNPSHGIITFNADGTFSYIPNANYYGTDSFTYTAKDQSATPSSAVATVTIVINSAVDAIEANPDAAQVNEDAVLNGASVLVNDKNFVGGSLSPTVIIQPLHGTVALSNDGTYTYTPAPNFNGEDSFKYEVCNDIDPKSCGQAVVTIAVLPVVDPIMATPDNAAVNEDNVLHAASVLANDVNVDGGTLRAVVKDSPQHGILVLNSDGSYTYTPAANYNGSDSFTYEAFVDNNTSNRSTTTVSIVVNAVEDALVGTNDAVSTNEDVTLNGTSVLANDINVDGTPILATVKAAPAHGTLSLNPDGTFVYTPIANYNGSDAFTYEVFMQNNTSNRSEATVAITINPVVDPVIATPDNAVVDEDNVLHGTSVLANDINVDGGTLQAAVKNNPSHGVLILNLDGTYTYTPAPSYNGPDSFTYEAYIDNNISNRATATVSITVSSLLDQVEANPDAATINEDQVLNGASVLANDVNTDAGVLRAKVKVEPTHGALLLNADGTYTYTPQANYYGTDSFVYTAFNDVTPSNSADATVSITVNPVLDPVIATADSYATSEDVVVNGATVLANDTNLDGGSFTAAVVQQPLHGTLSMNPDGTFVYTPAANYNGTDSFTYTACNTSPTPSCAQAKVTIAIAAVNDVPVAANDSFTADDDKPLSQTVVANDTPSGDGGNIYTLISSTAHGTLVFKPDGSFTYTATGMYSPSDQFTYRLCDTDNDCAVATASITIVHKTRNMVAPVAADDEVTTKGEQPIAIAVLKNDKDEDGALLVSSLSVGRQPAYGTISINYDGTITYKANKAFVGVDGFTYTISDDGMPQQTATAKVTVTVTVADINVPTAFTPNGDGYNDYFEIPGIETYPHCHLQIYNRWGSLVYSAKSYGNTWDGKSNASNVLFGSELPEGTYFYHLDLGMGEKPLAGYVVIKR